MGSTEADSTVEQGSDAGGIAAHSVTAPELLDQAVAQAQFPLSGMSVLIVDRARQSRSVLRDLVTALGAAQVIDAETVSDTILTLQMQAVHLIVCEYVLEDGKTAQNLLEALRAEKLLPLATMFVVVTGERSSRKVASVAEFAPDAYIVKPLVQEDVRLRLARVSHRKRLLFDVHAALAEGDIDAAIREAERIALAHPAMQSETLRLVSGQLVEANRLDEAERLARLALATKPYPWALFQLAQIGFLKGHFDEAERLADTITRKFPDHLAAYDLLARLKEIRGEYAGALECLDEVAGRTQMTASRLRRSGTLARKVGDLPRAESAFTQLTREHPADGEVEDHVNLVQVLIARGKHAQAERVQAEHALLQAGQPEAELTQGLLSLTRARERGDRNQVASVLDELAAIIESGSDTLPISLCLRALEVAGDDDFRELGYRIALALVRSRRADLPTLHRIRKIVDALGQTPAELLSVEQIPMAIEQLSVNGWDDRLGPAVFESIEFWLKRAPSDEPLRGMQQRLKAVARKFGIARLG
jgi:tetratricopeptide (TPR) repeat protein